MKLCSKCGESKPLNEFSINKRGKDNRYSQCKECRKNIDIDRYQNMGGREKKGCQSMYKNKLCSNYLGIVAAERLVKHLFNDVEMMPYGFPGYDLICNKGKKIDVKASTTHIGQNKNSTVNRWNFNIKHNKDCDFFLLMAFDNVIDCNPLNAWMVPGEEINENSGISISSTTIHKWDKWKMDMNDAQTCCDLMKSKV